MLFIRLVPFKQNSSYQISGPIRAVLCSVFCSITHPRNWLDNHCPALVFEELHDLVDNLFGWPLLVNALPFHLHCHSSSETDLGIKEPTYLVALSCAKAALLG